MSLKLKYEKWSPIMGGDGVSGTLRTVPENYYVATVTKDRQLVFEGIEAMTKDIDKQKVQKWFNKQIS